jgi:hypothetical protein
MGAMATARKGEVMKRTLIALAALALTAALVPASASSASGLTAAEKADLQYMREEEKLARDVYAALGAKWTDAAIFTRIAASEQRHMNAVKVVLDRYGIADSAAGKAAGRFTSPELQKLYDELVAKGSQSLQAALGVGVTIEEVDIADLEKALAETANADLERLYGNLLRGSQNHLRAFTGYLAGDVPAQGGRGPAGQHNAGTCTGDGQQQGARFGGRRGGRGPGW